MNGKDITDNEKYIGNKKILLIMNGKDITDNEKYIIDNEKDIIEIEKDFIEIEKDNIDNESLFQKVSYYSWSKSYQNKKLCQQK